MDNTMTSVERHLARKAAWAAMSFREQDAAWAAMSAEERSEDHAAAAIVKQEEARAASRAMYARDLAREAANPTPRCAVCGHQERHLMTSSTRGAVCAACYDRLEG